LSHDTNIDPSVVSGDEESVRYIQIDDKNIILDVSRFRITPIVYFALLALGAKGFYDKIGGDPVVIVIGIIIFSVLSILALFSLAWFVFYQKKYVIFDRSKGTVSIPGPFWYKNVVVPFDKIVATIQKETYYFAHLNALSLYRPDGCKVNVGINTQSLDALQHDWAFYVQYMDIAQPLPSVPVFEAYRNVSGIHPAI
jgi:hypothetical protein